MNMTYKSRNRGDAELIQGPWIQSEFEREKDQFSLSNNLPITQQCPIFYYPIISKEQKDEVFNTVSVNARKLAYP